MGDPFDTNDIVVNGTPTTMGVPVEVDWPVISHPPLVAVVYPDVWVAISVPAAAPVLSVLFSRIRIAVVPSGVPIAVPLTPAAPVGVR